MGYYLNIYLKTEEGSKPKLFSSYTGSSEVFTHFKETLDLKYSIDEVVYRDLTMADIKAVLEAINQSIKTTEEHNQWEDTLHEDTAKLVGQIISQLNPNKIDYQQLFKEAFKFMETKHSFDSDYKEYMNNLLNAKRVVESLEDILIEIDYGSDFIGICCVII